MRRAVEIGTGVLFAAAVTVWVLDRLPFMEGQR